METQASAAPARPFAYTPFQRALIALEQGLKLCPACGAQQQTIEIPAAGPSPRQFAISWWCNGRAVLWVGSNPGDRVAVRRVDPCELVTTNGVVAAARAAEAALANEGLIDADHPLR